MAVSDEEIYLIKLAQQGDEDALTENTDGIANDRDLSLRGWR